ncbi:MAG TPA: hypothetical protein VIO11_06525 [Candidatus Methanoperedens sp.]
MTEKGFHSITIPESLYCLLLEESKKISIGEVIKRGILKGSPLLQGLFPQGFVGSNPIPRIKIIEI